MQSFSDWRCGGNGVPGRGTAWQESTVCVWGYGAMVSSQAVMIPLAQGPYEDCIGQCSLRALQGAWHAENAHSVMEQMKIKEAGRVTSGHIIRSDRIRSVAQSCPTLCDPMNHSTQASLSLTYFWSSLRLTSTKSVMPSSHLILCRPLLLLPPIPPSIRVFSNESTLRMRWPKY